MEVESKVNAEPADKALSPETYKKVFGRLPDYFSPKYCFHMTKTVCSQLSVKAKEFVPSKEHQLVCDVTKKAFDKSNINSGLWTVKDIPQLVDEGKENFNMKFNSSLLVESDASTKNVTPCVFCEEFKVESCNDDDRENYFNHLEEKHGVKVDKKHELKYIFRKYFLNCSKYFDTTKKPATLGLVQWFRDFYSNDAKLREEVKILHLKELLFQRERERKQTDFKRKCFICDKYNHKKVTGNSKYFLTHLMNSHSICLGKPDNIVNVEEFLDLLENYVKAGKCFHCKKTNVDVCRHLRQEKLRFRPKYMNTNRNFYLKPYKEFKDFDRFYLINHIELGKGWEDLKKTEKKAAIFESEESKFSGWEEDKPLTLCLFCDFKCNGTERVFGHMKVNHKFDFEYVTSQIDFYEKVKVVNYIRRVVAYFGKQEDCQHLWNRNQKIVSTIKKLIYEKSNWKGEEFMQPLLKNDALIRCQNNNKCRVSTNVSKEKIDAHEIISCSRLLPRNDKGFKFHSAACVNPACDADDKYYRRACQKL